MEAIEAGLLATLGIKAPLATVTVTIDETDLVRITAERDTYKALVDQMIKQRGCRA